MQFFLGPMTRNGVEVALQFHDQYRLPLVFIPSRRQIDQEGGYVEGWTMQTFREFVGRHAKIERDHGGPGQGQVEDTGIESLLEDTKYADILHIDPWKKYPTYEEGLEYTIRLITLCDAVNPGLEYEVGTEESIRRFEVHEVDKFLQDLQDRLSTPLFEKIRYVVIQCGTALKEGQNTGAFDEGRLRRMLEVVDKYGKTAKEHNGDWITADTVQKKSNAGLTCINIAPELGEIESKALYSLMTPEDQRDLFDLCWKSRKWEKWVSADFDPHANQERLVHICGHYVLSTPTCKALKAKYPSADKEIRMALWNRLSELYCNTTKCLKTSPSV
jgi:hypothetical protein